MRKLMHSKKGFSLVELMIVVVIMGILVAVAIPVYGAVTKNAAKKTCDSNIKIIKENLNNFQMAGDETGTLTWADLKTKTGIGDSDTDLSDSATGNITSFRATFEGNTFPKCPKASATEYYKVNLGTPGTFTVKCGAKDQDAENHQGYTAATP